MRYRIHSDGLTSKNWVNRRMVQKSVSKLEKHNNLFTLIRTPRPHLLILTKVNMHLYFLVVKVKWFFYA
jgi:predicted regulator of amino acid metabolism with ACT domain